MFGFKSKEQRKQEKREKLLEEIFAALDKGKSAAREEALDNINKLSKLFEELEETDGNK